MFNEEATPIRVAHAVCPFCYPEGPEVGAPTKRLCGVTLPAEPIPDGERPEVCADCAQHGRRCPECRAVSTFLGMIPADDPTADGYAIEPPAANE